MSSRMPAIEKVNEGSHICHLYRDAEDLAIVFCAFIAAGLQANERCVWIAADPVAVPAARRELGALVGNVAAREASGQLSFLDDSFYGSKSREDVVEAYLDLERRAFEAGYTGVRVAGNVPDLPPEARILILRLETYADAAFRRSRMRILCGHPLTQPLDEAERVVSAHDSLLLEDDDGGWLRKEVRSSVSELVRRRNENS